MARIDDENHFRQFATNLELALEKYPDSPEGKTLLEVQRHQIRTLVDLEDQFRRTLIDHPWGPGVYRDFVKFIRDQKHNVLAARPFFRERQTTFTKSISGALQRRRDRDLYRFRFNWSFIGFVLRSRKWPAGGKIRVLSRKINAMRQELLEQNLPLAISQARIFWSNTPKSHLSYMDIVQIQCQALLLAVDKFVPPNEKRKKKLSERKSLEAYRRFRAVGIGIMSRDRVNQYSETLIHFYPKDKMKRYRALKAMRRLVGDMDWSKLSDIVNRDLRPEEKTDPIEIADLVSATTVSADFVPDPDGEPVIHNYAADEDTRPDVLVEEHNAQASMRRAARELLLREKKLLKMKGVSL